METLQELKRQSVKKVLPGALLLIVAAVVLFVVFGCQDLFKTLAPKPLESLEPDQLKGSYVKMEVEYIYGSYAYTEQTRDGRSTGRITSADYLVDYGSQRYIGILLPEDMVAPANQLMEECNAGRRPSLSLSVQGLVLPMEGERLSFYKEAVGYDSMTPAEQALFVPYYIAVDRLSRGTVVSTWALLVGCLALLAWGCWFIVKANRGGYQAKLRKKLAAMGEPERMQEELDRFCQSTEPLNGLRMGQEMVMFQLGAETVLLRPWEVAWAYQCTTQHRTNGIPTGKTYALRMRTMDGRQYDLAMKEEKVQQTLEAMNHDMPGTVLGYSKDLEELYKKDREAFQRRWEQARPGCTARA